MWPGNDVEELSLLPTIVMMDPPDHTKYRRLVSPRFTGRRVRGLEGEVRDLYGCACRTSATRQW